MIRKDADSTVWRHDKTGDKVEVHRHFPTEYHLCMLSDEWWKNNVCLDAFEDREDAEEDAIECMKDHPNGMEGNLS